MPTVTDIIKSWRNRAATRALSLKPPQFADGVETMNDLLPGMILEGG